ncbi:MAG: Selenocysteine lyase [Bacteroidetes bacterium HLUCCA01]|nr:MAG: Selenocysteine lyase [Bacteroidetes bacterium HLUCCA01]
MSLSTDLFSRSLARHYSHFDVENRLLFTGHSHQAWPDAALEGLIESFDAAARAVDTKWDIVFEKVDIMRQYLKDFYDDPYGLYTHGENTHNLFVRWLSGLDVTRKKTIVITDTEFYSIARQMDRLQEEGFTIKKVPALPLNGFASRLEAALDDDTLAVMLSRVYFETGLINPELTQSASVCREAGIPLMIDDYHGTNVVPLSLREAGLQDAFVLIGGYKYLQWGEGNCFLRFPADSIMRPVITGWFSGFSSLREGRASGRVSYDDADLRFAGATFDGASAFRGAAVVDFFRSQGLTPTLLRHLYLEHTAYMKRRFLSLHLDPGVLQLTHPYPVTANGGFLSLRGPRAQQIWEALRQEGVLTDCRGDLLRFGSAPYMVSSQIDEAFGILGKVAGG